MAKDGSLFNLLSSFRKFSDMSRNATMATVLNHEMQSLIKTKANVDVIVMGFAESPVLLGISKELKAPVIITSTQKLSYFLEPYIGAFSHDSFMPNIFLTMNNEISFLDRLLNTLANWGGRIFMRLNYWSQKELFRELFPNVKESLLDTISSSVQLMLLNSHFSLDRPMPYMTNMIEVGGMQIPDKINPLPDTLKTFIDNAKDGIIYFCMGGTLKIKDLDMDKKKIIVNGLKQTKLPVVIKWDDESTINELIPKDKFYASNWLPQNDILAHPKVKAYVTHGGLLSTTEAIYHGVPIVGMPIFADQRSNIKKTMNQGMAVQVDYETLSAESLATAINNVINDKTFEGTAKVLSERFRDRPMTPVETAKYWVEYVIRHKNKEFMRSPAMKLTMIEYFNWDVYLTILLAALIITYISWKVLRWIVVKIWSLLCKKAPIKDKKFKKS